MFEQYKDTETQIVGFNTCAGCPTLFAPDKILKKSSRLWK